MNYLQQAQNTGKPRVNARLPVSLVNAGIKMGARFSPQVEGLLTQHLNSGEMGRVMAIYNDEESEHVRYGLIIRIDLLFFFDRFDALDFREELAHGAGHPTIQGGDR
jgi:hypothetical protein